MKEKDFLELKKLKPISTANLLKEIQNRLDRQQVSRRDLLQLASIDWCLECWSNDSDDERKIEANGYCGKCNNSWKSERQSRQ